MFRTYFEYGLGIIPILYGKNPGFDGWQHYCIELPTKEKIEEWEGFKNINFGLPCGPANNIICLDIDTSLPEVMAICPPSPLRKVGKKGEARFFQYNPKIVSTSFGVPDNPKIGSIDLLSLGRQTIIPPSVHPETKKPYTWITPDRFPEFKPSDLPLLTSADVDKIADYFSQFTPAHKEFKKVPLSGRFENTDPDRKSPHGSQDRLKTLASMLVFQNNKSTDECAGILLNYDNTHHFPTGYFSEVGRVSDQKADPYSNALQFFINIRTSINRGLLREGKEPITPQAPCEVESVELSELDVSEPVYEYPPASGLIKEIKELADRASFCDAGIINLGGAISLVSALAANRFQSKIFRKIVTPNIYALNIAGSGAGKNEIQSIIRTVLSPHNLLGPAAYKSDSSFAMDLPGQPERLDLIDEASSILRLSSSNNLYETGLGDLITQIFSCAPTSFAGISSKISGSKAYNTLRPHISILGSTTPAGFKASVSPTMMLKGLMPRFMIFYQKDSGEFKDLEESSLDSLDHEDEVLYLGATIDNWIKDHKKWKCVIDENDPLKTILGSLEAIKILPFEKNARELWLEFSKWAHNKNRLNPEAMHHEFVARWAENAAKLALIHAVSLSRHVICLDSVEWGVQLIKAQWSASQELYEMASAENPIQEYAQKVLSRVKAFQLKNPSEAMKREILTKNLPMVEERIRRTAFESLIERGQLFKKQRSYLGSNGRTVVGELYSARPFKS